MGGYTPTFCRFTFLRTPPPRALHREHEGLAALAPSKRLFQAVGEDEDVELFGGESHDGHLQTAGTERYLGRIFNADHAGLRAGNKFIPLP